LSPTMEEGRLVEWKKQEGEAVAAGDALAEVETDKAVMELVARVSGVLLRQTVKAGQTVPVSTPVALIGEPGEPVPAAAGNGAEAGRRAGGQADSNAAPSSAAAREPVPATGGRVKASPLARRIAEEQGLDLRGIQ